MASAPARMRRSGRESVTARYRATSTAMTADTTPATTCMRSSSCRSWVSSPVNSLPSSRLTTTVPMRRPPTLTGAVAAAPACTGADGGCEKISLPFTS